MTSLVPVILRTELRQLIRDRRALFAAVLLPAFLYPLIFLGQGELEEFAKTALSTREVKLALDFSAASPRIAEQARALLELEEPIQLLDVDASELATLRKEAHPDPSEYERRQRELVLSLFDDTYQLLILAEQRRSGTRDNFHLYFDIKDDLGREAKERATRALEQLASESEAALRLEFLGGDPASALKYETVDIASEADSSGAALAKLLPLLAVLVLLSGGSYAALAIFAGERESGTLETLLVQPAPAQQIAWGKFLAVLVAGLVTLACNLASLIACVAFDLGGLPGLEQGASGLEPARLLGGLVYLPGCILLCALLCLFCGRARSFREGQHVLLPIMLFTLLPTWLVTQPEVQTDPLLAAVPMAGPALLLRDALRGDWHVYALLSMLVSHALWSWLALGRLASVLDAERILGTADVAAESNARGLVARTAMRYGFLTVLATYTLGGLLQSKHLVWGLLATLWILLPTMAAFCSRALARATKRGWLDTLQLRAPSASHALGAFLLAPTLALLVQHFGVWQAKVLPLPQGALGVDSITALLEQAALWKILFVAAISPSICEELIFRGPILWGMRQDWKTGKIVLWQAIFFGAAHASIYRLLPTAFLGGILALVTLRTRSLIPAILLHITYDAWLILGGLHELGRVPWLTPQVAEAAAWAGVLGAGLLMIGKPPRERGLG